MAIILRVAVISILLSDIEELVVKLEENFSILPMQGFCCIIYDNSNEITGYDPNEGKKKLEREMAVTTDVSDVGTGGGIMP